MNVLSEWDDLGGELHGVRTAHRARAGDMPLLLVHGIGPGTTGWTNFAPLVECLSPPFAPHLIDLAGFGLSGRLPRAPFFDVGFWLEQIDVAIRRIIDRHGRAPLLVGNSVGGALALKMAGRRADLPGLVAIGAPASPLATPELRAFWSPPQALAGLAEAMRPMTGAALEPDPAIVATRFGKFAEPGYADYFAAMLDDPASCLDAVLPTDAELAQIDTRVVLMHGRLDRVCPAAATIGLLARLPHADLMLFGGCGHNLMSEHPTAVSQTVHRLSQTIGKR